MEPSECDVLVVGAGPTGLLLAAELLAAGVRCRIVEQNPEPLRATRALTLQPHTLQQLGRCGLLEDILRAGQPLVGTQVHTGDTIQTFGVDASEAAPPVLFSIPQPETERIIADKVRRSGGVVERGLRLVALEYTEIGARATLRDRSGRLREIRCRWLIGCDGRDSAVRRLSHIPAEDSGRSWHFLLLDATLADSTLPRDHASVFLSPEGFVLCIPIPGPDSMWRIVLDKEFQFASPSLAALQHYLDRRGFPDPIHTLHLRHQFDAWQRCAARYRDRSVFLAGDAAHWLVPVWGQGLNTGLQDALALSGLLARVCLDGADDALLNQYEKERLPVARDRIKKNQIALSMGTLRGSHAQTLRNNMLPSLRNMDSLLFRLSEAGTATPA